MSCITCGSDRWVLANGCYDENDAPVPICEGCREVLVQLSLGFVRKQTPQLSSTLDVEDMSDKELHELAKELGV